MPRSNIKERSVKDSSAIKTMRPALTPEADEQQLISLATDVARRQLLDGTASSQVLTHFLVLGSSKKRLESEIMELQKDLLVAKTEAIRSTKTIEELYSKAIKAMRVYSGHDSGEDDDE